VSDETGRDAGVAAFKTLAQHYLTLPEA